MKTLTIVSTLALAFVLALPGTVADPNPVQSGDNSLCSDYNVLYNVDGVNSPLAVVTVEGATNFTATHDGGAMISVDFYNADGAWIGYSSSGSGRVPASAAFGTICVSVLAFWPDVPAAGATWTYQDGL